MTTFPRRYYPRAAAVLLGAFIVACQSSDVIAPDGASISLFATPAQIVLAAGIQKDPVMIQATVFNSIGAPLPGQDVRFTTSSGILDPVSGTPVTTDKFGTATTILTKATTGPQINARSGKVIATPLTLNAATGILSGILLTASKQTIDACSDTFTLIATAVDPSGNPIKGVTIIFDFGQTGATFVAASFNPIQDITDVSGKVDSILNLSQNDCTTKCASNKTCDGIQVKAKDQSGTVISTIVNITDQVP